MTPSEMIAFFGERSKQAQRGMAVALSSKNYHLAAFNCRQGFKCRLMKALIQWRMGIDPSDSLSNVVQGLSDDWAMVAEIGGDDAKLSDIPSELAAFPAYLIGKPCSIGGTCDGLEGDRLLDVVMGDWLRADSWNDQWWDQGMNQLRRIGSDLAVRTHDLYKAIANAGPSELPRLLQEGELLFARRRTDSYFSGGDQTEGGGRDNDVTVDYRLAALLKHAGFVDAGQVHVWKW